MRNPKSVCVGGYPPHGRFLNLNILGLRSYVEDEEVKSVLNKYGELKSEVILLKYKADHQLAGLEKGNHLVVILDKPSIPYSCVSVRNDSV